MSLLLTFSQLLKLAVAAHGGFKVNADAILAAWGKFSPVHEWQDDADMFADAGPGEETPTRRAVLDRFFKIFRDVAPTKTKSNPTTPRKPTTPKTETPTIAKTPQSKKRKRGAREESKAEAVGQTD
jgi:hypothetical protein